MRKLPYLLLLWFLNSSCVTISDATFCAVAGDLSSGGICSHLLTPATSDLTEDQFLTFLEASPTKAAAICMSAQDFGTLKTELELACRELGSSCSYQTQAVIKKMK